MNGKQPFRKWAPAWWPFIMCEGVRAQGTDIWHSTDVRESHLVFIINMNNRAQGVPQFNMASAEGADPG